MIKFPQSKISFAPILAFSMFFAFVMCLLPASARAANVQFGQKILPMDCVFEEVNDGTGTITYITPAQCGQVISPPAAQGSGASSGVAGTAVSNTSSTSTGQFSSNRSVFFVQSGAGANAIPVSATSQLPWQPLASANGTSARRPFAIPFLDAAVAVGVSFVVMLLVTLVVFMI